MPKRQQSPPPDESNKISQRQKQLRLELEMLRSAYRDYLKKPGRDSAIKMYAAAISVFKVGHNLALGHSQKGET